MSGVMTSEPSLRASLEVACHERASRCKVAFLLFSHLSTSYHLYLYIPEMAETVHNLGD